MSNENDNTVVNINALAASWLRRKHFSDWNKTEQGHLDAWLEEALAHRIAYWRLNAAWNRTDRLAALRREVPARSTKSPKRRVYFSIVASLAIAILLAAGASRLLLMPQEKTYATGLGGYRRITLSDGSKIELNTNTVVRLEENAKRRIAWIDQGEAYFRIKHDASRPFAVIAGPHRIVDVGTQFLVRRDSASLEVTLIEGQARFDDLVKPAETPKSLLPGDIVVATATSTTLMKESPLEISSRLGWRHGVLVFKHTTLKDAAEEFNRYNSEKIIVADIASARLTISGTFRINDVEAFTDAAHGVFGLRIETRNGESVISR